MPTESQTATVDARLEDVWNLLIDVESWPRWLHVPYASESVTIASPAPTQVGTELILKGRMSFRLFARITQLEEMRGLAFEVHRSEYPSDRLFFQRACIAFQVSRLTGKTQVTCTHQVEGKGPLGRLYMATAFRPFLDANVKRVLRSLARSVLVEHPQAKE